MTSFSFNCLQWPHQQMNLGIKFLRHINFGGCIETLAELILSNTYPSTSQWMTFLSSSYSPSLQQLRGGNKCEQYRLSLLETKDVFEN